MEQESSLFDFMPNWLSSFGWFHTSLLLVASVIGGLIIWKVLSSGGSGLLKLIFHNMIVLGRTRWGKIAIRTGIVVGFLVITVFGGLSFWDSFSESHAVAQTQKEQDSLQRSYERLYKRLPANVVTTANEESLFAKMQFWKGPEPVWCTSDPFTLVDNGETVQARARVDNVDNQRSFVVAVANTSEEDVVMKFRVTEVMRKALTVHQKDHTQWSPERETFGRSGYGNDAAYTNGVHHVIDKLEACVTRTPADPQVKG